MDYTQVKLHQSGLKHLKSIEQFLHYLQAEQVQTPAMAFGTALHCAVLTPSEFDKIAIVGPDCSKASKEYKAFAETAGDKIILKPDEMADIEAMKASLLNHPISAAILGKKENVYEQRLSWEYPLGNNEVQACEGTPDIFHVRRRYIADLKTCEDASLDAVIRTIGTYEYHLQAEFYRVALIESGFMKAGEPISFYFIFVEKSAPYSVQVVELDESWYKLARRTIEARIRKWRAFVKHPYIFRGYADQIITLSAPKYLEYKEEEPGATKLPESYKPAEQPKTEAVESPQTAEKAETLPPVLPEVPLFSDKPDIAAPVTVDETGQAGLFPATLKEQVKEKYSALDKAEQIKFTNNIRNQFGKAMSQLTDAQREIVLRSIDNFLK